jgi:hypothetical protein
MAYSFGRQFRRTAALAIAANPDGIRMLIRRILPPRDDGAAPVLHLKTELDCELAPTVIVAAFFADVLTGDEAADLLAEATSPATRKRVRMERLEAEQRVSDDRAQFLKEFRAIYDYVTVALERKRAERCSAANGAGELVKNKQNTSAPCGDAAENIPERPKP